MPTPPAVSHLRCLTARETARFSVTDPLTEVSSVWELRGWSGRAEPLHGYPSNAIAGAWSADGSVYAFLVWEGGQADVWISREPSDDGKPVRLTAGALSYHWPLPSHDGRRIFAVGQDIGGQLVRYDAQSRSWRPFLGGINAFETDFARNGRWVAYVTYPDRTLWRSNRDGAGQQRLTSRPLEVVEPHWSPDGKRIAFMGRYPGGPRRVFIVPAQGGDPVEATTDPLDEGVPTWSPDGRTILFGEPLYRRPASDMALHVIDVATGTVSAVPGSQGLWTARWSPDGKWIAALSIDNKTLMLLDTTSRQWRRVAAISDLATPAWSSDSALLYFISRTASNAMMYRLRVPLGPIEPVADVREFVRAEDPWQGILPDGTPLAIRYTELWDIYAIAVH